MKGVWFLFPFYYDRLAILSWNIYYTICDQSADAEVLRTQSNTSQAR